MEIEELRQMKVFKKIAMLTAYDYQTASILDNAGIDMILVGDSLGMVVLGYEGTKQVTMTDMIRHIEAVARAVKRSHIVGDMPVNSYDTPDEAVRNAQRLMDAGADSVKIEGLKKDAIEVLISSGIPVMGHLGLLPQTAEDFKVKGKEKWEAERIYSDALELDSLGVYSIVLECIPLKLAKDITESVNALTIGIGAGRYTDGQVLVINDMLGMSENHKPKHVKTYANLSPMIKKAVLKYIEEVKTSAFPTDEYSFH